MPIRWIHQFRRAFASCLTVRLQVHLLGAAMLHRHGEMPARWIDLRISGCDMPPSPFSDGNPPCTACQIVHNGAVQPGGATQALPSPASIPLVRLITTSFYHSEQPATSLGRASPFV